MIKLLGSRSLQASRSGLYTGPSEGKIITLLQLYCRC